MSRIAVRAFLVVACLDAGSAISEGGDEPRAFLGRWLVSDQAFPLPPGTTEIPIPGGDFEAEKPPSWPAGGEVVTSDDAPQGKRHGRIPARQGGILMTPAVEVPPGRPLFLSFALRSPVAEWAAVEFPTSQPLRSFGDQYPGVPDTGGRWKHVGYYVLVPADATSIRLQIHPMQARADGLLLDIDDVRLRTASFEEMSAAYLDERRQYPPYDLAPRPGAGRNLALSVAKWEGRAGIPGRPFLIWAIGSSWTNFQGDGYPLIRAIRERFPNAPPIVYRKHAGSASTWEYARGWVEQFVAADSPDLILTYTNGRPEGLDALLSAIRRRTTADILVPSLHFFENSTLTDDDIERGAVDWNEIRTICRKHGAEFVENRRELAEYLKQIGEKPKALLSDAVHQNRHGETRIWDNIVRHVVPTDSGARSPERRERRISAADPVGDGSERVVVSEGWTKADGVLRTRRAGASLKVEFVGNRIDLIGRNAVDGGTARILLDGKPAHQAPAFATTYIRPEPGPGPPVLQGPGPGDVAPHAVGLGENVVPQSWTITMTGDSGEYRLIGSVTGSDGEGNSTRLFLSRSGQIAIDPALWRHNKVERPGLAPLYGNRAGDRFTFDVLRTATAEVSFRAPSAGPSAVPLARNLTNAPHTLEIVTVGSGEVVVEGFYIHEPMPRE